MLTRLASMGAMSGFFVGPLDIVTINDPQFLQSFLVEHTNDFDKGWSLHRSLEGNGIFISEGEFHRKQRKIMAPAFQPRQVAGYADIMAGYAEKMVAIWQERQEIAIGKSMSAITLSVIGKTLFDEDVFTETDALGQALIIVFDHAARMIANPFALPAHWPTPFNHKKDRAWAIIRSRIQEMIDERRAHPKERNDFLSLLMEARDDEGQPMADEQLMDEAATLFSGGQETVASSLIWTWCLLCQHPEIYQRLQQEVDSVLQGRTPTLEDLKRLPYCLQVYKEVLRLYPPAPTIIRQALRDCVLTSDQGGGAYLIKKGTTVLANIHAIHRISDFYPDPDVFDPTRFTPEKEKQLPRHAFAPFGAGPRICIGNHFSMLEGHIILATLAQRVTSTGKLPRLLGSRVESREFGQGRQRRIRASR